MNILGKLKKKLQVHRCDLNKKDAEILRTFVPLPHEYIGKCECGRSVLLTRDYDYDRVYYITELGWKK